MNLAERLGYRPDDRVLIIHADDVGVCHAANQAAIECMERGSITCGSILMPCPWAPEVAEYCRNHPDADLGVHLTLNCEYPGYRWRALSGRDTSPTLYDEQGYMWRTTQEAVAHISPEDGAREMRAQVETALAAGIDVTHLDTHMGTMLFPAFIEAYISLGIEFQLPLFLIHPAKPSDELSAIAEDAAARSMDYELFRDGAMRAYVEGLGVHPVGYREIREAYRSGALKS
jgi:predicted glycoside hydrolase/deacetylase ChbG (UPF0249 family)